MTAADFRRLALSFDGDLMLTPEIQAEFVADAPDIFLPVAGGWGRMGATHMRAKANRDIVTGALRTAWQLRVAKNAASRQTKRARAR